ncbi:hypothetical protein E2C01_087193 [Portunus trituberculatus]|uniref:Uncharacterized protein n=1 Tax=Portunus trituberculatus TaxID=210409 RepID=A0A5B7J2P6_PORTR|nr:hypothetical protein [Portunus trituberculatus]
MAPPLFLVLSRRCVTPVLHHNEGSTVLGFFTKVTSLIFTRSARSLPGGARRNCHLLKHTQSHSVVELDRWRDDASHVLWVRNDLRCKCLLSILPDSRVPPPMAVVAKAEGL